MTQVQTSFEDLEALGYTKEEILKVCQGKRNNTISGTSGLHLNDDWTEPYPWNCYNILTGQAGIAQWGQPGFSVNSTKIAEYDNTSGTASTQKWTGDIPLTSVDLTSLSISKKAVIKLDSSITIHNVAGSGVTLTIGTEDTQPQTANRSTERTYKLDISVASGEKVVVYVTTINWDFTALYEVPYGLDQNGTIGTDGKPYDGHRDWGYNLNEILNSPGGKIGLTGIWKRQLPSLVVVHIAADGTTTRSTVSYIDAKSGNTFDGTVLTTPSLTALEQKITEKHYPQQHRKPGPPPFVPTRRGHTLPGF